MINYKVRALRPEDIPEVIEVALASTYQYSKESLLNWIKYDPEGIIVAVLDSGKIIGLCATVIHNGELAFGGGFCVLEAYRHFDVGDKYHISCAKNHRRCDAQRSRNSRKDAFKLQLEKANIGQVAIQSHKHSVIWWTVHCMSLVVHLLCLSSAAFGHTVHQMHNDNLHVCKLFHHFNSRHMKCSSLSHLVP
ncbi:hypothetical protein AVEN_140027-1 [Araneus ventricosus]|uniref:N-acetyltransferase domain-containing protein n=1 Tax=Araneus ventricosus TaxID=182803 RepID=A0A4Y2P9J9_ARAVE|nr:hypothetical protein AVEN_140027-1 [Araneus ventricosus]